MRDFDQPRLDFVQCLHPSGLHRMAYWEWGDAANPDVVVCVHGLSRQGRDFDRLARRLSTRFRVVCPDIVGRGRSDWLDEAMLYQLPQYRADVVTLLARLRARRLGWVGTSMGGLIGLGLSGLAHSPIQALVLNDIGPAIAADGLDRIIEYVGNPPRFASEQEGIDYLARISIGFGRLNADEAREFHGPMLVAESGGWRLHYDPRIAAPLAQVTPVAAQAGEQILWGLYDQTRCPTLLLRGSESDLLSAATAQAMHQRGPRAECIEVPDVGHAPSLLPSSQVDTVATFLLRELGGD